jgi:cytochrome P450
MPTDQPPVTGTTPSPDAPLDTVLLADLEYWQDGPPHEIFARMRTECPVHWTPRFTQFPEEDGFWSVTRAEDVHEVSRDWQTYSSEIGGMTALKNAIMPLELQQAMFIGMDPPKHDRLKALFQRGFTPSGSPSTRSRYARSPAGCSIASRAPSAAISSATSRNRSWRA